MSLSYLPIWQQDTVSIFAFLFLTGLFLSFVFSSHSPGGTDVSLVSFGAEDARIQLGAAAPAPAAGRDAHAALRGSLAVATRVLQPLAVRLALCALRSVVSAARRGAGGRLGGDGAQQVVPLP